MKSRCPGVGPHWAVHKVLRPHPAGQLQGFKTKRGFQEREGKVVEQRGGWTSSVDESQILGSWPELGTRRPEPRG